MTKDRIRNLRILMNDELQELAVHEGLKISVGSARYTDTSVTFKLEVSEIVEGVVEDRERAAYRAQAKFYGLEPDWLDREVNVDGRIFKITGINPRARKLPVRITEVSTGQHFHTAPPAIIRSIEREVKA